MTGPITRTKRDAWAFVKRLGVPPDVVTLEPVRSWNPAWGNFDGWRVRIKPECLHLLTLP